MHFKTSDGVQLNYETTGQGFPLIMLNGLWGDARTWDKQIPVLERDYTCIRLEHRGIAKSEKWPGPYSYDLHARDVRDLLDHLKIRHCITFGVCHGGMTAVTFAKNHPDRLKAVIINGTQVLKSTKQRLLFAGWKALIQSAGFEDFYRSTLIPSLYSESFLQHNEDRIDEITAGAFSRMEQISTLSMLDACCQYGLSETDVTRMQVPALIMSGDEDAFVLQNVIKQTAKLWPGSEYHAFTCCGHFPQREATSEYNQVIQHYLLKALQPAALLA